MALTSGTKLGPYEIISPLGAGGMGEVYRARDTRLGRDVAIKVLPEALAHDADRLRRFEQEARTIAALNHPNILGIHDIGVHGGAPFLVSEFLEGQTLREKLVLGPLPVRRAIECALGIAEGLAAAHDKGIVHRDLKPENLFVTRDGKLKVLDFGIARIREASPTTTRAGAVFGTPAFMPPEQALGRTSEVDERSDLWAVGATAFTLLTGRFVHEGRTPEEMLVLSATRSAPPLLTIIEDVPEMVAQVIDRALA